MKCWLISTNYRTIFPPSHKDYRVREQPIDCTFEAIPILYRTFLVFVPNLSAKIITIPYPNWETSIAKKAIPKHMTLSRVH